MNTLILRFIQGDPEAFKSIYLELAPRLRPVAYRHCRNPETAVDVVQDVFAKLAAMDSASRKEHFGGEENNLEGWLVISVKHRAMDILKIEEGRRKKSHEEPFRRGFCASADTIHVQFPATSPAGSDGTAHGRIPERGDRGQTEPELQHRKEQYLRSQATAQGALPNILGISTCHNVGPSPHRPPGKICKKPWPLMLQRANAR